VTLFVNDPKLSTPTHQAFLAAKIRAAFDLAGVPLVLRYRSSHGERESNDAR
jgi:predicted GTPase